MISSTSARLIALLAVIGFGMTALAVGVGNFRMLVEKTMTHLVMPMGLCWLSLSALLWWLIANRESPTSEAAEDQSSTVKIGRGNQARRFTTVLAFLVWLAFYLCSNGMIAKLAMRQLDGDFCEIDLNKIEPLDAIVVLGGCTTTRPNGDPQLNNGGDRVMTVARLYHADKVKKIICTGSLIPGLDRIGKEQSQLAIDLLSEIGVPSGAMQKIGGRNTTEEMAILGQMFDGDEAVGLCTSAWHLKRAMRLANAQGFHPTPIPSDFRTPPDMRPTIVDFVPTADAAETISLAAKEWLAWIVGR